MEQYTNTDERVGTSSAAVSRLKSEGNQKKKGMASHTLGLLLLLCVVCAWTLSNFLGSSMFADDTYAKPFFITYINTGAFTLVAIPTLVKNSRKQYKSGMLGYTVKTIFSKQTLLEFIGRDADMDEDAAIYSEREVLYKQHNSYGILPTSSTVMNTTDLIEVPEEKDEYLPLIPTARRALAFCILWFGANYLGAACLQHTTVASTTILTSTASVWTLIVGTITRTEKFTWRKLCGVLASFCGILLISRLDLMSSDTDERFNNPADNDSTNITFSLLAKTIKSYTRAPITDPYADKPATEIALGDALALASAVIYGIYAIVLKRTTLAAHPRKLHMPTFFGLVGFFNLIVLFPLFSILHFSHIERFSWPPTQQVWATIICNALISMTSDVLWAYAMIFTSPLVVTVGLSLNIPLSLVGEMFIQDRYEGWIYWVGAMVVVGSFVFVEREEVKEEQETTKAKSSIEGV